MKKPRPKPVKAEPVDRRPLSIHDEFLRHLIRHGITVHLHVHDHVGAGARPVFDLILARLQHLDVQLGALTMASAEMKAALSRIDDATNNIAADLTKLKDTIKPGMTDAEVAEVQSILDAAATKLEGVAASTD